jgi:hypothetical protein
MFVLPVNVKKTADLDTKKIIRSNKLIDMVLM